MKKVLFTATVDSHILHFHIPYLKWFKEQGYEVHVATNGDEIIPFCDVKHKITFDKNPLKMNNLKAIRQLKKIIYEEKYEMIHCHTPIAGAMTRIAAIKARKQFHTKVIYTAHGFHFFHGAPLKNWLIFYPVEKILSYKTDCLITINEEDYNLAKKKFHANQTEFVYGVGIDKNKFDFEMTKEERDQLRDSLGIKKDDFVMIIVGELNKNKNQIMVIEAMKSIVKQNDKIKLLLAGTGKLENYYKEKVKEYKLEDKIIFTGYRRDIPQLLKISDLLLSLSKREGLPLNVMEALICRLPIIATNCRGNRDLVKKNVNGYIIEIDNIKELNEAINKIYHKKDTVFQQENKSIAEKYTLENVMNQMERIYKKKVTIMHLLASNRFSGAEKVACTIIKNLDDKFESFYCSPYGIIEEKLKEQAINYRGIDTLNRKNLKKIVKLYQPDFIHAHDFKASLLASRYGKKIKIVSHIHKNDPKMKHISLKSVLYLFCSKNFYKIIGVSDAVINEYLFSKSIKNKYITIPNFVDKDDIIKKSNEIENNQEYDLFYFGRLSPEKNPLEFIEIIKQLKNDKIKCVMIGEGVLHQECVKKIKEYSLEKNIEMVGFQTNPYPFIKNSKIGIMPSKYEGFGLTAVESIILGKPVLNSGVGGLKEIFIHHKQYICDSIELYVKNIKDILANNNCQLTINMNVYTNKENYKTQIKEIYQIKELQW